MSKKLLVVNFKSNKTLSETQLWFEQFLNRELDALLTAQNLEVITAPPFVFIDSVNQILQARKLTRVQLATQDLSPYPAGSYTGAISAINLSEFALKYVIVGHSERRRWFHETSNDVALKVEQALNNKLTPIVCVDDDTIAEQASKLDESVWSQVVVAYEPQQAIGSGLAANPSAVKVVIGQIRQAFGEVKVLYGGSVNELNVNEYLSVADGILVGSVALDVTRFQALVTAVQSPPTLS